jgi:hypothetical protein
MSLTSQLHGGELAAWCAAHLPGTAHVAAAVATATHGHRPVRPAGPVTGRHWAEIGGAFGLRLAALVQPAPPYYSLHGLVRAGLVSRAWADAQAGQYLTHTHLPAAHRRRALELRPTVTGWLDLGQPIGTAVERSPDEPVLADLLDRTRRYLAEHAPTGRLGTPAVEAALARVCWLLSAFEDIYRTGEISPELRTLFGGTGVPSVEQLRAAAPEPVTAELVELARQLHTSGSLADLRDLAGDPPAGHPLGIASPVLVNHWADGDLLLSTGHESVLLDVKTVIRTDNAERTGAWLWQLLGYAWLDLADRYRIRTVGLYLARHGVLVTWGLNSLADMLLGGTGRRAAARGEFRTLAHRVLSAEGAQLPA